MEPSKLGASTEPTYDDSSWTVEEKLLLAARAGSAISWADMGEYDNYPAVGT
jgi:hypothetical protein